MPASIKQNNKREKQKQSGGFTLIEILVSLAIFTMIIGGVTLFGVRAMQAHMRSQAMQNALENARFAMDEISKRIRTSNNIIGDNFQTGGDRVFIISNTGTSYCYEFNDGKLTVKKGDESARDCDDLNNADAVTLVGPEVGSELVTVKGKFYVKPTSIDNNHRGLIRMVIIVTYNKDKSSPFEKDEVVVQTTVSLRDYGTD